MIMAELFPTDPKRIRERIRRYERALKKELEAGYSGDGYGKPHPNEAWMKQIARNVTMDEWGFLESRRYLIHDRDTNFTDSFRAIVKSTDVEPLKLPARSPNLNAYAERWVKSVKDECLSKLILFGEASLRRALRNYLAHYHGERNHQGKDNVVLFPTLTTDTYTVKGRADCRERLGGLLKYYYQEAA